MNDLQKQEEYSISRSPTSNKIVGNKRSNMLAENNYLVQCCMVAAERATSAQNRAIILQVISISIQQIKKHSHKVI